MRIQRQVIQSEALNRASQEQRERLKAKLEADPEYQRRKRMTSEERHRETIESFAKDIHDHAIKAGESCPSFEKAKAKAQKIAEAAIRKNGE